MVLRPASKLISIVFRNDPHSLNCTLFYSDFLLILIISCPLFQEVWCTSIVTYNTHFVPIFFYAFVFGAVGHFFSVTRRSHRSTSVLFLVLLVDRIKTRLHGQQRRIIESLHMLFLLPPSLALHLCCGKKSLNH